MGHEQAAKPSILLSGWRLEVETSRCLRGDQELRLEPRVMQVLVALVEARGQPLTRHALMQDVWGHEFVTPDALNRAISKLRRVLSEELGTTAVIDTLPKIGYRLRDAVGVPRPASDGTELLAGVERPAPERMATWLVRAAGIVVIAAVVALIVAAGHGPSRSIGVDGGVIRPLTSLPGTEAAPDFSPDGSQVVFSWGNLRGSEGHYSIYVQALGAASPTRLTEAAEKDLSPVWSPDGREIAFLRMAEPTRSCAVMAMPASGGAPRRIAECRYDEESLAWSPQGDALVFVPPEQSGLVRLDLRSGALDRLTTPGGGDLGDSDPRFSGDGRKLAFVRWHAMGVANLFVAPAAGGEAIQVSFDNLKVHGLAWEADSQHLIYSSNRAGGFALWRISADGRGEPTRVPVAARSADQPAISRDGRRLVYEEWQGQTNIFAIDTHAPEAVPVALTTATRWDWNPAWSPDGSRLAFVSDRSGSSEIWLARADGTDAIKLTAFDGPYTTGPGWSPDGSRIVFDSPGADGNFDIYVQDAAGGNRQRITEHPAEDRFASFSPDGAALLFSSRRSGEWEIWRHDMATGADTQLTRDGGYFARWQADGQAFYFSRIDRNGLWRQVLAPDARVEAVLDKPIPEQSTNWAVSGTTLWFVDRGAVGSVLVEWDLDAATQKSTTALPRLMYKSGISLAPDGRVAYARVVRDETDLVVKELQ